MIIYLNIEKNTNILFYCKHFLKIANFSVYLLKKELNPISIIENIEFSNLCFAPKI